MNGPKQKLLDRAALGREIRAKNFRVLAAVLELCPDGCGRTVATAEIAARAGVSQGWVRNALAFFRRWRVLWLRRMPGAFEVRFERPVLVALLAAQRTMPGKVRDLMEVHKGKREGIAPLRRAV